MDEYATISAKVTREEKVLLQSIMKRYRITESKAIKKSIHYLHASFLVGGRKDSKYSDIQDGLAPIMRDLRVEINDLIKSRVEDWEKNLNEKQKEKVDAMLKEFNLVKHIGDKKNKKGGRHKGTKNKPKNS